MESRSNLRYITSQAFRMYLSRKYWLSEAH